MGGIFQRNGILTTTRNEGIQEVHKGLYFFPILFHLGMFALLLMHQRELNIHTHKVLIFHGLEHQMEQLNLFL